MDPQSAYRLGQAMTDAEQAGRQLWKTMLPLGRSSAWFVLGYWGIDSPNDALVEEIYQAIQARMAYISFDGFWEPEDESWAEWLACAPVAEAHRARASA
ncbi:MAG: hypothetical protein JSV45_05185 [Chromatiales bacterium]|nr:MAG: hypothetical protein JSV45_05185 [Chromatiales bacterium]